MKVITSIKNARKTLLPGDCFIITLNEGSPEEIVFKEEINEQKMVEYIATYRYADLNGNVDNCSSLYVSYGDYKDYIFLTNSGKLLSNLSREQQANFLRTSNIKTAKLDAEFEAPNFEIKKRPPLAVQIFHKILSIINEWAKK